MGVKHLPSYRDYWPSRLELPDSYISSGISHNRVTWLLGNIHLNDNSITPSRNSGKFDKLCKMRPPIKKLPEICLSSNKLSKNQRRICDKI